MSFTSFALISALVFATLAQSTNTGGLLNGLRYTFTIPALSPGCAARPALPLVAGVANTAYLCFFVHEFSYIYATDCGDKIIDRYAWAGFNNTLPGFTGEQNSSFRWISDGTLLTTLRYTYGNFGNIGVNNITNNFFAITTDPDRQSITSFSWYSSNCRASYVLISANAYKPYSAWGIKYAPYLTTNFTYGNGGFCGNGVNNNNGVCITSCTGQAINQGWTSNIPTVVCVDLDRYNSYILTDCRGRTLTNYWWRAGGNPLANGVNPGNVVSPYFPYGVTNNYRLGLYFGGNTYNGYYLEGNGPCAGSIWRVPLTRAVLATSQPSLTPVTGLYRLISNVAATQYNNWHFTNGLSSGFAGSSAAWQTSCNTARDAFPAAMLQKNMQLCLLQVGSNSWRLTDCVLYRTKNIIEFGWNGVSWSGWEGTPARPIVVTFDAEGKLTGWSGIHNNGMCRYTYSVMTTNTVAPYDPPTIANGLYARTYTPAWDFLRGNRQYYSNYNSGYGDWSEGNCTVAIPDDTICYYNVGDRVFATDCAGTMESYYRWSGLMWESPSPFGPEAPRRSYWFANTLSFAPDGSFETNMVRGGCQWVVTNTPVRSISGPKANWGHYTMSASTTKEGSCLPTTYSNVGIYPSGMIFKEHAIQDWATGEIYVILKWDGSNYVGYDKWGMFITAIVDTTQQRFAGITGYAGDKCTWSISYDFTYDAPVLPRINGVPAAPGWKFTDAYGVWNGKLDGGTCGKNDPDLREKYNTLICIWPNGPAVLNLIQCNDNRADYQTILQQAWWKGGSSKWMGVDYGYIYDWNYVMNDNGDGHDEITFLLTGTGNDGCQFNLLLWRGDDCETAGWKAGISVLSVFSAALVLIVLYLFTAGGGAGGGGGGGYHEYQ